MTSRARTARLALMLVGLVACDRGSGAAPSASSSSTNGAADARPPGAQHLVQVDPGLLDAGRIRLAPVVRRAPTGSVRVPADVVATAEGAAEAGTLVAGRVARFVVKEGDHVVRGQVLAWLDAPEAARALADVLRARAREAAQVKKVARLESLVAAEATSALAVDEARLELATARADLAAARTVATSLGLPEPPKDDASPTVGAQLPVRSPTAGIVSERAVALGAHVSPETKLFRIVSEGRVLVDARLADGAPVSPAPGAVVTIQSRGSSACRGRVLVTLPQIDPATRTRKVRVEPDGPCPGLAPGGQAEVSFDAGDPRPEAVVTIAPATAIVEIRGATFAFVAARGGFEARPVDVGVRVGDDAVVRAGLEAGEQVVVEGAVLLKGELIRGELGGEP